MKIIRGTTRIVFVGKKYVYKIPTPFSWKSFLLGLLGNMDERLWSGYSEKLCPVVFSLWGGWFAVMKRTEPLVPSEYDYRLFEKEFAGLPLDNKIENFGKLGERIVLIDYTNDRNSPWVTPYHDNTKLKKEIYPHEL